MKLLRAFKFRVKTNIITTMKLASVAGCNRLVWNKALALQKERLEKKEYTLSYNKMASELLAWKSQHEFLKDCPSQTLQQTLMAQDRGLKDAFNKKSAKRFPQFKKKGRHDSFRFPQGIKVRDNEIFLPKIGWLKFFKSREIETRSTKGPSSFAQCSRHRLGRKEICNSLDGTCICGEKQF
jgi:putative transposase